MTETAAQKKGRDQIGIGREKAQMFAKRILTDLFSRMSALFCG
jgi:hypothetical protein